MNIVVTGASRGIGFDTVFELSRDLQNHVIAISRNEEKLRVLQEKCRANGKNISIHKSDISNLDARGLEAIIAPYGHIDVLINNAGTLINKKFADLEMAEWKMIFDVNLFGTVNLIKALLPYMKKNSFAHIVNIGSMGGVQGTSKFHGLTAYSASKAAIANLTECLAEELKEFGISVNCLALGSVNTEMLNEAFPDYRAPTNADEMAKFIAYFSLNAGRLMNGKIIPVSINTP
jgi:3-oxoacyl-[acyl-carrier protein] reductase